MFLMIVNIKNMKIKKKKNKIILLFILNFIFIGVIYAFSCVLNNNFYSCSAANIYGIENISTPRFYVPSGWSHASDRDGDGISCESKK